MMNGLTLVGFGKRVLKVLYFTLAAPASLSRLQSYLCPCPSQTHPSFFWIPVRYQTVCHLSPEKDLHCQRHSFILAVEQIIIMWQRMADILYQMRLSRV